MVVLVDVAVIKQVAALNPFPSYSYRGVDWGRSLFTSGVVDACDRHSHPPQVTPSFA
jgi:hypothetical protein